MSSEGLDFEDVPEDHRWDLFGVVLGNLQDAGYDLDRFTDGEQRAEEYRPSVVCAPRFLNGRGRGDR